MLRDEILIFIVLIWLILTATLLVDGIARIERVITKTHMTEFKESVDRETVTEEKVETVIKDEKKQESTMPSILITTKTESEPEQIKEVVVEQKPIIIKKTYYDVPLDEDLQDHIFAECAKYNIDPAIVIAMIGKESVYNEDAIGDGGNSHGLMQIQPRWHYDRIKKLGVTNLFNPYQNVTVGVDILAELFATGKSTEWVLMAYNGGRSYANEKIAFGIVSDYANTVLTNARTLGIYFIEEEV